MTDNINFSGSVERALKGDFDPINIAGLNPSRAELRANQADRGRRAAQIKFEQSSESLKARGGTTDEATKQVKKLKGQTQFASLSPFAPPGPLARTVGVLTELGIKKGDKSKAKSRLSARNAEHAATALTVDNLKGLSEPNSNTTRLSQRRLRRSILGGASRT